MMTQSSQQSIVKVGRHGTVVIPAPLRKRFGMHDGDWVMVDSQNEGIVIRPAILLPIEHYSTERKAEFLLSNAIDAQDYAKARKEVQKMGLDPDKIPHHKPKGV